MYMHCFLVCIMLCTGMLHSALRLSCKKSTFLAAAQSLSTTSAPTNTCNQSKHLVVLSHGLMGTAKDLTYLATKLQQRGFTVLTSQCNELFRSYQGIAKGAERLVEEVHQIKKQHPDLARVSFVGNSLGGLYVRYAISLLHNQTEGTIAGLQPAHFMTIATPHLGVRDHTFLEDLQLPKFDFLRKIVALTMLQTGQELFYTTHESRDQSILYEMATQGKFVNALKAFQQRRLYANLQNDFLVPLGTAAFLTEQEVLEARSQYGHGQEAGIVGRRLFPDDAIRSSNLPKDEHHKIHHQMISSLNSCGWEKIFVHFPGVLPNAHNKICALQKYTPWIDRMLGFEEGRFVMDEASEWFQP